jgi:glutamyl-tRNA reductase
MNLLVIGLNHRTAPVEVRERFARAPKSWKSVLPEAVYLSTCNRVELYGFGEPAAARPLFGEGPHVYELRDRDCVRHLWEVACGLDSMVLGETEILGQVKDAYEAAHRAGATGPVLNRLFQKAFAAAKHIRTHTGIARGSTSVGNVAVDLAGKIFRDLAPCTVMVVGTGEMSEATAKALRRRGAGVVLVCSRTHERAEALAGQLGGEAISYEEWPARFPAVDIVISATAAPHPILTREKLVPLMKARRQRPLFLIDIAVPRDIERACGDLEDVFLYDIDDLQQIAQENVVAREKEIGVARALIAERVEEFWRWFEGRIPSASHVSGEVAYNR